jgi:lysozyme family protein
VNSGLGGTAKIAQQTCNTFGAGLAVDGKWGPKTKAAVWKYASDPEFSRLFLVKRKDYYDAIISRDKSQEVFRSGWYNRLKKLALAAGVKSPV